MRVLVIEDNSIAADALTALLQMEGHAAYFSGDGLSALTHLAAPSEPLPDVIVLDLRMPGMDGEEFLDRIAANEKWRDIPVILMSAASLAEQAHVRQRWPGLKFLPKPCEPDALLDALKGIEAQPRGTPADGTQGCSH